MGKIIYVTVLSELIDREINRLLDENCEILFVLNYRICTVSGLVLSYKILYRKG
jgi:hypothetical protein